MGKKMKWPEIASELDGKVGQLVDLLLEARGVEPSGEAYVDVYGELTDGRAAWEARMGRAEGRARREVARGRHPRHC